MCVCVCVCVCESLKFQLHLGASLDIMAEIRFGSEFLWGSWSRPAGFGLRITCLENWCRDNLCWRYHSA